jgi:hypothetical protein
MRVYVNWRWFLEVTRECNRSTGNIVVAVTGGEPLTKPLITVLTLTLIGAFARWLRWRKHPEVSKCRPEATRKSEAPKIGCSLLPPSSLNYDSSVVTTPYFASEIRAMTIKWYPALCSALIVGCGGSTDADNAATGGTAPIEPTGGTTSINARTGGTTAINVPTGGASTGGQYAGGTSAIDTGTPTGGQLPTGGKSNTSIGGSMYGIGGRNSGGNTATGGTQYSGGTTSIDTGTPTGGRFPTGGTYFNNTGGKYGISTGGQGTGGANTGGRSTGGQLVGGTATVYGIGGRSNTGGSTSGGTNTIGVKYGMSVTGSVSSTGS